MPVWMTPYGAEFADNINLGALSTTVPIIDPEQLVLGLPVGEGAFCRVYESSWTGRYASDQENTRSIFQAIPSGPSTTQELLQDVKIAVAVKVLKSSPGSSFRPDFSAWQNMLWEGQVLHGLHHRSECILHCCRWQNNDVGS